MATLLLKFKNTVLQEFPITKTPIMVGREHNNDIVIDNLSVSRYHIRIQQDQSNYIIEDLDSGNGSFINDTKLTKCALKDKDEITVGKHTLTFIDDGTNNVEVTDELDTTSLAEQTFLLNAKALPEIMALRAGKPLAAEQHVAVQDDDSARPAHSHNSEIINGKPTEQEKSVLAPPEPEQVGEIEFIAGRTMGDRVKLTKRTSFGGKSATADIQIRGLFVGGIAFIISKKNNRFYITHSEGLRKTKVNGTMIKQPSELQDGFIIAVGSNKMLFHVSNAN